MSIKLNLATATFVLALASLSDLGSALAGPACDGSVSTFRRGTWQCYYLPTVANGRVTGLQKHVNIHMNYSHPNCRSVPVFTGSGRSLGSRWLCT